LGFAYASFQNAKFRLELVIADASGKQQLRVVVVENEIA
jgi:hypothetical protein